MNKLSLSTLAFAAAMTIAANAQTPAAKPTGTIDQLRVCLDKQDEFEPRQKELRERGEKLLKTTEAMNVQAKEIDEESQRVSEDMNATGSGRRARFERKERAFKKEREAHIAAQEAFNADRKKIDEDFAAFRQNCADKSYMQDDIDAVRKERAAAGKK